jgi:hypothetical protein
MMMPLSESTIVVPSSVRISTLEALAALGKAMSANKTIKGKDFFAIMMKFLHKWSEKAF